MDPLDQFGNHLLLKIENNIRDLLEKVESSYKK